jgi:hypothetical protein
MITQAQKEIGRLQGIMKQKALDKRTREEAKKLFESLSTINLEKASFAEKRDLLAKLGIKVYPSEDYKNLKIVSNLHFETSRIDFSRQMMSIASPKL